MHYRLIITTEPERYLVRLRLQNPDGRHQGSHQVRLTDHPASKWEGVLDTRRYVDRYKGNVLIEGKPATAEDLLAQLGVFLGQQVLGSEILSQLQRSNQQRTVLVSLPGDSDPLTAALARIPWEMARGNLTDPPLLDRNLVVRIVTEEMRSDPIGLVGDEIRVLLVFAEAPGSRPLAMRLEREHLLKMFYDQILPKRRVRVEVICHGVTERVLRERIRQAQGFHVVHWSGHGHVNALEILGEDGRQRLIEGEALVRLFEEAGGFAPRLVFLSACLSGSFMEIKDWQTLAARLMGEQELDRRRQLDPGLRQVVEETTGYTGTALALLHSGVDQVVAMRYEVGDDYARELAREFYRLFLQDRSGYETDQALTVARKVLFQDAERSHLFGAIDHANPVVFGQGGRVVDPPRARSEQLTRIRPEPQPLLKGSRELDPPGLFVGRGEWLRGVTLEWLDGSCGVALIQGLAGLGKTSLAAEIIHVMHQRFDWVLVFQAKPDALSLEMFLRDLHLRLLMASGVYREVCERSPYRRIYFEPDGVLRGAERYRRLRSNLVEALRDEPILVVLDNFEQNLESVETDGSYDCQDPEWGALLREWVERLPETRSRLLVTCRHRVRGLVDQERVLWVPLGPLPMGEAILFIRSHPVLRRLVSGDAADRAVVMRLLDLSHGHPLIMDRLAALAGDGVALTQALDRLQQQGMGQIPDLFAEGKTEGEREQERRYLEDVAIHSVDLLIERLDPEARRLLWIVTLANEPVSERILEGVWAGRSSEEDRLEEVRQILKNFDQLPEEIKSQINSQRNAEERLRDLQEIEQRLSAFDAPPIQPLLKRLQGSGLLTLEDSPGSPTYAFHELVKERILAWMTDHPEETAQRTPDQIWIGYGERYEHDFNQLLMAGRERAREAAVEAGRRGVIYFIRARAFDRLGDFASKLVTSTQDPSLLRSLIGELQSVVDQVPPGRSRWSLRVNVADALRRSGQPDLSLLWYEQAAQEAEAAENWSDVAWIQGNWAVALVMIGQLDQSRDMHLRSADSSVKAGRPRIHVVGRQLEALRIEVMQGRSEAVLLEITERVKEVQGWWQRHQQGERIPEAPDPVFLGRALVSALDIARMAHRNLEQWEDCLRIRQEIEQAQRDLGESEVEISRIRFNQYFPLLKLDRWAEAQQVLEQCLAVDRAAGKLAEQAKDLGALADLWDKRGDQDQAIALQRQALAVCNQLADPWDRAISHGNLSIYLETVGSFEESAQHLLAEMIYDICTQNHGGLQTDLNKLRNRIREAKGSNRSYPLPSIEILISLPQFTPLATFLQQRSVEIPQLQSQIDQIVSQIEGDL